MSDERKTRRRFLADALFAGGAVAASVLLARGYLEKPGVQEPHPAGAVCPATPPAPPVGETPASTPQQPTLDLQPDGGVRPAPPREIQPEGRACPPTQKQVQIDGDVAPPRGR